MQSEFMEPPPPDGPFEGPEKLLEIWFTPDIKSLPPAPTNLPQGIRLRPTDEEAGDEEWVGLRRVPSEVWEEMLDIVKCKVLSMVEGDGVDAYLLSESSFFVFPHKLIMKTCGTTLNLLGLPRILQIAQTYCGLNYVYRCFYSRKTFMFPDRQLVEGPHRNWTDEVGFLDGIFDNGSSYIVGPTNGDHWLLYVTAPHTPHVSSSPSANDSESDSEKKDYASGKTALEDAIASAAVHFPNSDTGSGSLPPSPALTPSNAVPIMKRRPSSRLSSPANSFEPLSTSLGKQLSFSASSRRNQLHISPTLNHSTPTKILQPPPVKENTDQTLEILMTHLSPKSRGNFFFSSTESSSSAGEEPSAHQLGATVSAKLGLDQLFDPSITQLDSYAFTPCGYSGNALISGTNGGYWTIHVTPEEGWSYASFECNVPLQGVALKEIVKKIVNIFEPGRMTITRFVTSGEGAEDGKLLGKVDGFRRTDRIGYEFDGYDLMFCCFEQLGFKEQ